LSDIKKHCRKLLIQL